MRALAGSDLAKPTSQSAYRFLAFTQLSSQKSLSASSKSCARPTVGCENAIPGTIAIKQLMRTPRKLNRADESAIQIQPVRISGNSDTGRISSVSGFLETCDPSEGI